MLSPLKGLPRQLSSQLAVVMLLDLAMVGIDPLTRFEDA